MFAVCPCKGCIASRRYPGCHSKCPEYLKWKDDYEVLKEAYRKEQASRNEAVEDFMRRSRRARR